MAGLLVQPGAASAQSTPDAHDLHDLVPVPRDTDFASVIRSSEPTDVQHTRLDWRQPPHALLTTVAWAP